LIERGEKRLGRADASAEHAFRKFNSAEIDWLVRRVGLCAGAVDGKNQDDHR
jgi:hypothetical protein